MAGINLSWHIIGYKVGMIRVVCAPRSQDARRASQDVASARFMFVRDARPVYTESARRGLCCVFML